jgi:hypothetical protein
VTSYWSFWTDHLVDDKGNPGRRDIQTWLADRGFQTHHTGRFLVFPLSAVGISFQNHELHPILPYGPTRRRFGLVLIFLEDLFGITSTLKQSYVCRSAYFAHVVTATFAGNDIDTLYRHYSKAGKRFATNDTCYSRFQSWVMSSAFALTPLHQNHHLYLLLTSSGITWICHEDSIWGGGRGCQLLGSWLLKR